MNKKKGKKIVKKTVRKLTKKSNSRSTFNVQRSTGQSGIQPLGDRVLLKPLTAEEAGKTTTFGIIIPETIDKEKPEQGTVIAVGPGKRDENGKLNPIGVSVGDKVMFSKYGYDEVKVGGIEYYIVSENNILAIINR